MSTPNFWAAAGSRAQAEIPASVFIFPGEEDGEKEKRERRRGWVQLCQIHLPVERISFLEI